MPWKPAREVRVQTRAELEAAMRSADRIVVDGDASLAAYAALLANGGAFDEPHAAASPSMRLRPIGDVERAAHAPRTARAPRLWPWVAGAAVLLAGAAAAVLREHFSRLATAQTASAAPMDASLLLWPAVAVAVLLAMFFALRQATGDTVHAPAAWRAEAPSGGKGRVIITKVHRHPA
jgi:hypothetical protein